MELLDPEQRTKLARQAAQVRWENRRQLLEGHEGEIFQATHTGELPIAGNIIQCAVLNDNERTRIISRNAIFRAFGRSKRGRARNESREPNMPSFIDAKNLQPFVSKYIEGGPKQIVYKDLKGKITTGYNALLLPQLCDVYLEARRSSFSKSCLILAFILFSPFSVPLLLTVLNHHMYLRMINRTHPIL